MTLSSQSISRLAIPYHLKSILAEAGYKTLAELGGVACEDLATETGITSRQAEQIVTAFHVAIDNVVDDPRAAPVTGENRSPLKSVTAAQLLSTTALPKFSTSSAALDELLAEHSPAARHEACSNSLNHGGIVPGMSVEISGPPGSGKSVIGIALAVHARSAATPEFPEGAEVLIVDTEGAVTAARLRAAAEAVCAGDAEDVLSGIHLVRIPTQVEMIALLHTLDEWLDDHPKIRLVVIDTLSSHFRQPNMDMNARRRVMDFVKERIGRMTTVNRCAVLIMNQLATKLLTSENKPANFETGDRAVLMPQLGDTWTTSKTLRLVLFRGGANDDMRYAHASSAGSDEGAPWAQFDISSSGLPCDLV